MSPEMLSRGPFYALGCSVRDSAGARVAECRLAETARSTALRWNVASCDASVVAAGCSPRCSYPETATAESRLLPPLSSLADRIPADASVALYETESFAWLVPAENFASSAGALLWVAGVVGWGCVYSVGATPFGETYALSKRYLPVALDHLMQTVGRVAVLSPVPVASPVA